MIIYMYWIIMTALGYKVKTKCARTSDYVLIVYNVFLFYVFKDKCTKKSVVKNINLINYA